MKTAIIAALLASLSVPVLAANADEPNKNVDKSNDQGGPTGNDKTDALNKAQQTPTPASTTASTPAPDPAAATSATTIPEQVATPPAK